MTKMMRRIAMMMVASLLAAGVQAAEQLSLPFSVCGKTLFEVGDPVQITFQGEEEQAYELTGVVKKGHVYYVPNGEILVLKDAQIESGGFAVQRRTASSPLVIQVKGQNSIKATRTAIQSVGSVLIVGEGVSSHLDFTSRTVCQVQGGGDVTLRSLQLTGRNTASVIATTGQFEKEPTLELEHAVIKLTSTGGSVVSGFANVVTTGCGLPMNEYAAQKLLFDKSNRVFQLLSRVGTEDARELSVSCMESYITVDTRPSADSWSMDDGQAIDDTEDILRLPYTVAGSDAYTAGGTVNLVVDGDEVLFYELSGAADEGIIYYQPEKHILLFDHVTLVHENTYYIVRGYEKPLRIMLVGENNLTCKGSMVYALNDLIITGEGSGKTTLTLNPLKVMDAQPHYALHAYKSLSLTDLTFNCSGFEYTFHGNMPSGTEPASTLSLTRVAGSVKATNRVAYGFSNWKLTGSTTSPAALTYTNHQIMSGTALCKEMKLTAGSDASASADDEKVFEVVEQKPSWETTQQDLIQFLKDNIQYPSVAEDNGVQGRVVVSFIVETDGTLSDVKLLKSVDPFLDKEALRVINLTSGHWKPGRQNGRPVRVRYSYPVSFHLRYPANQKREQ